MRRLVRMMVVAFVIADVLVLFAPVGTSTLGPFTAVWDTKTAWDTGTKVDIDTQTNSCLAQGNGIQLNATGDFYGPSFRCPTGSPKIPATNLVHSFNFDKVGMISGYPEYADQVGFTDIAPVHGVTNVTAIYGKGASIPTGGALSLPGTNFAGNPGWAGTGTTVPKWTVMFQWYNAYNYTGGSGAANVLMYDFSQGNAQGYIFCYFQDVNGGGTARVQFQYYSGGNQNIAIANVSMTVGWHTTFIRTNYTDAKVQVIQDNAFQSIRSIPGAVAEPSTRAMNFGGYTGAANDGLQGIVDSLLIWDTWIPDSWISTLTTSGSIPTSKATYASFGSWQSPRIQVTDMFPAAVVMHWSNVSGNDAIYPYVAGFDIFNSSSGAETFNPGVFATGTFNVSILNFSASFLAVPPPRGTVNWTIEFDLQGGGANTSQLLSAEVTFMPFAPLAVPQPTLDTNAVIFLVFVIVILALVSMAYLIHPMLGVFGGLVTFFFALWLFTYTANTILTVIVFGFGAFIIVGSLLMDTDRSGRRGPLGG